MKPTELVLNENASIRKPSWLRVRVPGGDRYRGVRAVVRAGELHTVCEEARCPNAAECWESGTATFLILGDMCTRGCAFCAVTRGAPGGITDQGEAERVAEAVARMALDYAVVTSVTRDDLPDGGAEVFAETVCQLRALRPPPLVELLIPDYTGKPLATLLQTAPDVLAHNVEVVERLTPALRHPRFTYRHSLDVLAEAGRLAPEVITKSSILLGLGESRAEVLQTMDDLRGVGVEILVLGQYLQPTQAHAPVREYVHPDTFAELAQEGQRRGFGYVAAGPLVRTSYRAAEAYVQRRQGSREAAELSAPSGPVPARSLQIRRLEGLTPYAEAHALQLELLAQRQSEAIPDTLLLLEHPPVITLGRNADPAGVLASKEALTAAGIELHRVERGGQATYHGPGQVVGYPILKLSDRRLGVKAYVDGLEEVMIRVAARFGVTAQRRAGQPGIYTEAGKLGAIGVAVSRGVTYHGFALNVAPDLSHYRFIVPCGQADIPPVSMASVLGGAFPVDRAFTAVDGCFREVFAAPRS